MWVMSNDENSISIPYGLLSKPYFPRTRDFKDIFLKKQYA